MKHGDVQQKRALAHALSVSSNGSTWVKLRRALDLFQARPTFSILERIDVGETRHVQCDLLQRLTFSILERIDVGETAGDCAKYNAAVPFSILERIDVGETVRGLAGRGGPAPFSILERIDVGETSAGCPAPVRARHFQYPRTDRRG